MAFSWKEQKKKAIKHMESRRRTLLKLGITNDAPENDNIIKRLKKELGIS